MAPERDSRTPKWAATVVGYDWTEEEIGRLFALAERSLAMVGTLDALALRDVEPAVQYRIL